jgi:hypothetical protein
MNLAALSTLIVILYYVLYAKLSGRPLATLWDPFRINRRRFHLLRSRT